MRSPWLSREYEKSENVKVKKSKDNYILINKENHNELMMTKKEFERYNKGLLNEIEWEKLFFMGLAVDKNCKDVEVSSNFNLMEKNL